MTERAQEQTELDEAIDLAIDELRELRKQEGDEDGFTLVLHSEANTRSIGQASDLDRANTVSALVKDLRTSAPLPTAMLLAVLAKEEDD